MELTLNVLRPASRASLSLWCIYNDLRITSAVHLDSIETPPAENPPASPLAFCCFIRESDDTDRLDLRGEFGAVCVDSARREITAKWAKKNLAVSLDRICEVFFVDQRESRGFAICV